MTSHIESSHLGEREFLDYPVFSEADHAERREVLRRALVATGCVLVLAALGALVFG
jgi:hypothetical protein